MSIFSKKTQEATVAPVPSLSDQLFSASEQRGVDQKIQEDNAAYHRNRAIESDQAAGVAAKEAAALAKAATILDEAGVTF